MKNLSVFIEFLEKASNSKVDDITKFVATEALNSKPSEISGWFEDLLEHGCKSGMISELIYYVDTKVFFMKHYVEIIKIKAEYENAIGEPMKLDYQLANQLSWFSVEYTASKLYAFSKIIEESSPLEIETNSMS